MTSDRIGDLAKQLADAWARAVAVAAPTTVEPSLTTLDAYAIQEQVVADRVAGGRRIAGWKMGLTSADPPATPIVGTLLDDMIVPSGTELSLATMVAPMVEAELVVRIGEEIDAKTTVAELITGPHHVGPGLEVIDYRTTNSVGPIDWIADNSTVAYAVIGDLMPVSSIDLPEVEAALSLDGRHLASGRGSKVMGNPLAAVAWLSEHLLEREQPMQEGDVILTGSLTGHHRVPQGSSLFTADFGALGMVSVAFYV